MLVSRDRKCPDSDELDSSSMCRVKYQITGSDDLPNTCQTFQQQFERCKAF